MKVIKAIIIIITAVVEETAIAPAKVVVEEEDVIGMTMHLPNGKSAQTCRDVINFKYT